MRPLTESDVVAGRYRLGAVVGRGGMAEVRTAEDLRLGRSVAVKLLRTDLAEQDGVRERFEDEARAAARLSHPNVVAVFDTGEHEGIPYIVMELLPGSSLADLIAKGPLDVETVRRIGMQVLAALDAAHAAGLIHRDIKPANVLLAADGTAKVADFGIAKSAEAQTHTATGMLLGTAAYVPPERLAGHPATAESDLYSVGVLLYETVTGHRPFGGETPIVIASAIQRGRPRPITELRPDLDPDLVAVIQQAMLANPYDRFRSAGEMAEALAGGTVPMAASPSARTTRVGAESPTTQRRATEVLGSTRADRSRPATTPPAMRPRAALALAVVLLAVVLVVGLALVARDGSDSAAPDGGDVPAARDERIPEPLDRALNNLEEAVRP
ncbi:MAG TPA: serine/threonine-protein kinase [Acidimicrobiales bacterium]|nr:serine/threonine-protein kinase [Acidimicrobiales bacterium]